MPGGGLRLADLQAPVLLHHRSRHRHRTGREVNVPHPQGRCFAEAEPDDAAEQHQAPPLWTDGVGQVQVALFLPEQQPKLAKILSEKVSAGASVRILLGDPDGDAVQRRGEEEGIGNAIQAKVRNVLTFYEPFADTLEIRLHNSTLYNSIYRFDKDMTVNNHIYGQPAAHNPAIHLRQLNGGELFDDHLAAFDRIWYNAKPAWS